MTTKEKPNTYANVHAQAKTMNAAPVASLRPDILYDRHPVKPLEPVNPSKTIPAISIDRSAADDTSGHLFNGKDCWSLIYKGSIERLLPPGSILTKPIVLDSLFSTPLTTYSLSLPPIPGALVHENGCRKAEKRQKRNQRTNKVQRMRLR